MSNINGIGGFTPGKSGNPSGRPPKSKCLSDLLNTELEKGVSSSGKKIAGKKLVAQLVTQVLTTGRLQFPDDTEPSIVSVKDWIEFCKWAYNYLEPPIIKQEIITQAKLYGRDWAPDDWDKPKENGTLQV
jgi:hypothetical protein